MRGGKKNLKEMFLGLFKLLAETNEDSCKLRNLSFCTTDLSSVPVSVMVAAISRLEVVDLVYSELTQEQLIGIFTLIAEGKSGRLLQVWLGGNELQSLVPVKLFHGARQNRAVKIMF